MRDRRSPFRRTSVWSVLASLVLGVVVPTTFAAAPAGAAVVTLTDSDALVFNRANGVTNLVGTGTAANDIVLYKNVGTFGGQAIDAAITTVSVVGSISNYDNPGSASTATGYENNFQLNTSGGEATLRFEFFEGGTYTGAGSGIPVTLQNVKVTSIDLDNSQTTGGYQYSDFSGFQKYSLTSPTNLTAQALAASGGLPARVRFKSNLDGIRDAVPQDQVLVKYDAMQKMTVTFGNVLTGQTNYFGLVFGGWPNGGTPVEYANSYNTPPTSTDTAMYVADSTTATTVPLSSFGTFADADGNPFTQVKITQVESAGDLEWFNGNTWVDVTANQVITTSDIERGYLRYTATGLATADPATVQFMVHDGLTYSVSANTLTLTVSAQGQTITFANPGQKAPTDAPFASNATASSGLPVTLTSSTPGVCTVSGGTITPVASGTCVITATQSGNATYGAATPVTQTFPISTLQAQTITFNNPGAKSVTDGSIASGAVSTSGLTVTLTSLTPSVCTITGLNIVIVGPGTCTVRATQDGNGTYAPATRVEQSFLVSAQQTYTVTYSVNGGSGTAPTDGTAYTSGQNATGAAGTGLSRTGYTFAGWNTAANGSGTAHAVGATIPVTADVTLYAQWTAISATFAVTYDVNGGSGTAPTDGTAYTSGQNATGAAGTGLSRTGYTFAGWNTAANGSGTAHAAGASIAVTANVTLYAQWTANANTLAYDLNGATGTAPSGGSYTTGQSVTTFSGTAPTRSGYTFTGWNTAANGGGTSYASGAQFSMPGANVTLYAQWTANNNTLAYDLNGATGTAPSGGSYTTGQSVTTYSGTAPTRSGYTFTGWNTAANGGGTSYTSGQQFSMPGANVTLYAQWTANAAPVAGPTYYPLTVTTSGSGSVSTASGSYVDGTNVTVSATPAPGFKFTGWGGACSGTSLTVTVTMTQARSCTALFEPMVTETKDSTTPASPVVIPPSTTIGETPGNSPVETNGLAGTLIVSPTLLPTTKGIASATLKDGKVTYVPTPGFSGKTTVPLEYTAPNGQKTVILVPVTVDPVAPKAGEFTPKALNQTTLAWQPSPNAVAYEVRVNGVLVCQGAAAASCDVKTILGPKAVIEVTAIGNDDTRSTKVLPAYAPKKPVPAFTINFDEDKFNLKPLAVKKLNAFVKMMKQQGFTKVFIEAHTDGQGGAKNAINLSNQRATITAKYLSKYLKVVINKTPAGEKAPVASNDTETGRATNRRATGSVI